MGQVVVFMAIWVGIRMAAASPLPEWRPPADHAAEVCFHADGAVEEYVRCHLGLAGVYPPLEATYSLSGCCFGASIGSDMSGSGMFWALGERGMSEIMPVEFRIPEADGRTFGELMRTLDVAGLARYLFGGESVAFQLRASALVDMLVLDDADDSPVAGARVSVADMSLHLVSYVRETDEDGYVVLPMIAGHPYSATIRAAGYLQPAPVTVVPVLDEDGMPQERVIMLDRGVSLSGTVVDERGVPVPGAQIVVSVADGGGREIWHSSLDRPHAFSQVIRQADLPEWSPARPTVTADGHGRFRTDQIPKGTITVYAVGQNDVPGEPVRLDARETDRFDSIRLITREARSAWVRVADQNDVPVPAVIYVMDASTGHEFGAVDVQARPATRLVRLPAEARVTVVAEGFLPHAESVDFSHADEWTFVLERIRTGTVTGMVTAEGRPLAGVRLAGASNGTCTGKTGSDGVFSLSDCGAKGVWIHAEADGFAPYDVFTTPRDALEIPMDRGVALPVRLENAAPVASCTLAETGAPDGRIPFSRRLKADKSALRFVGVPRGRFFELVCESEGRYVQKLTWTSPGDGADRIDRDGVAELIVMFEEHKIQRGRVLEKYSADAAYAVVEAGQSLVECDEGGRFELLLPEGGGITRVTARHWLYGQGEAEIPEDGREITVYLDDRPPKSCADMLQEQSVRTAVDGAALQIDEVAVGSPWNGRGLRRGDFVESCDGTLVLVRDDRRIRLSLK